MATRNERKKLARKARQERKAKETLVDQAKLVRETVRLNRLHGIERNYWPESLMGSLKSMGCYGKVGGLSRLAPLPDAKGDWRKAVANEPIDWQAVKAKRLASMPRGN